VCAVGFGKQQNVSVRYSRQKYYLPKAFAILSGKESFICRAPVPQKGFETFLNLKSFL
jgi:hypothetical protein